jgi:hypothetical protein
MHKYKIEVLGTHNQIKVKEKMIKIILIDVLFYFHFNFFD